MGFCWRDLRERNHLEVLGVDGRIIYFNIILFKMYYGEAWTGLISFRIGTGEGRL
jgi:hypothetical protein